MLMKTSNGSVFNPLPKGRAGLTLVEVLVVLALLAIVWAMMTPAFDGRPMRAGATWCMNNTKQLTCGWLTYAADNQDQLMPNPGWVTGVMDWNPNNPDNTNADQLIDPSKSLIGDYVKSSDVFKCPADNFTSRKFKIKRVRSYSLNAILAGTNGPPETARMTTDLNNPGPAMIFSIVCEHPDSINDGVFQFESSLEKWVDLPSGVHPGPSSPLAYVDGHAEIHKWVETSGTNKTVYPVTMTTNRPWAAQPVGSSLDYQWMQERMPKR